jgi:MFS family permease
MQSVIQYRHIRKDIASNINHFRAISKQDSSNTLVPEVSTDPLEPSQDPFLVEWDSPDDPLSPRNWSQARRAGVFLIVWINVFAVDWAASADSQANSKIAREFHVSEEAETLSPTLYTFGIALGALFAGPLAETVGRTPIYVVTRVLHVAMLLGVALAPNFGAQCAFRFLAGFGASTLLAIHGASVADLYNPVERTLAWPAISLASFLGTAFSPIAGGWMAYSDISFRWCEWVALILSAVTLPLSVCLLPETFAPIILSWKAKHIRDATGDSRFVSHLDKQKSITQKFKVALQRALHMVRFVPRLQD